MKRTHGRVVDVESLAELDLRVAAGATSLSGWRLWSLDLGGRADLLEGVRLAGATFVGCVLPERLAARAAAEGALVLPAGPAGAPGDERPVLYTPEELYDTAEYATSLDGRSYTWSQGPTSREAALVQTAHDHAVEQALTAWAVGRRLVGVMGGHALRRDEPAYADAARLAQALGSSSGPGSSLVVATGGGPGAMEAANLGAWMAGRDAGELDEALAVLAEVPSYRPSVDAWVRTAFAVRERFPDGGESLGIPTWHYGHEPPNVLATAIAKYFRNSTREALLLEVCDAGIVFLPGAAGTVQEVFQDACENYYADESSVAPMVLVGREHWTSTLPVWPLLQALARGRAMEPHVHLVDTVEEAAALLRG